MAAPTELTVSIKYNPIDEKQAYKIFANLIDAGFNEDQAMTVLCARITAEVVESSGASAPTNNLMVTDEMEVLKILEEDNS